MNIGMNTVNKNGLIYHTVPQFCTAGGQKHCFTTRIGGVSTDHLSSLNLGVFRGDDNEHLKENFNRVFSAVGFHGDNISITHQTHSTNVVLIKSPVYTSEDTDALITDEKNIPIMSYYADCVPMLFYDKKNRVIATAHAGWRGTCNKIAYKVVEKMKDEYNCHPSDILCAIGPSIGPCHFETDADVPDAFIKSFGKISDSFIKRNGDKYYVDLWQFNAHALKSAGIEDDNITLSGQCTVCHHDLYFSNRAGGGKFGSMGAIIELDNK